ncbi:RPW8 domain-containing protein [Heracleum sosnowskyi]|uniref:RPW8 domain-containing protein n=1 Tax=Heracleum sosnowskyi TaxID=360622 RepID=A0AAD8HP79_9APIA|nr:RPW8 domain-containing protein [Heracleum sosnowskyi]
MAFIIDAALGAGFSELFKVVKVAVRDCLNFRSNLKNLESTLESVKPMFYEIGKLNRVLNRPEEETDQFIETLNRGVILVYKCSTVPYWNPYKLYTCSKKLEKLDKCIVKFFNVQVQGFVAMSSLRNGRGIKEINDKIDFVLKFFNIKYKYTSARVCDDSLSGVSSWESVLGLPDVVFGFNKPLQDLKEMLLQDKELVKVISSPRGFGKTTLAKLLCHDPEIQGIFGKNILFVTVSKSAKRTSIVEKILRFQLPESLLPEFQNDDDAIRHLKRFLKQISPSPILLVLDDVWPNMESLIDSLSFTLPNFKILVTSRFCFPRFSHVYNLESLDHEDAMSLFSHSARLKYGSSNIPSDLVEKVVQVCKGFPLALIVVGRSLSGCPEVVWRRKHKIWSDGKFMLDTHRAWLDCLPTSLNSPEQMKDCRMDLGSSPEDQRISATSCMGMLAERCNLDHKDMDTHSNLDHVCERIPRTINIHIHFGYFPPTASQGKSKTPNAGKGIKVDKVKSKTIQRSRPKLQLKGNGAFQIRTGLSGVVIREPSLQVISSQATSKKGGKDREKVVPEPKNKALKPEANRYYIDRDESGRLLQELRGLSFNSAVLVPSPSHVRRPPTNGTFSSSNQWNSQLRKGLPGVVIREPSSQVIPSQASQHEATSTKVGKGKEKVIYQPKKKDFKPKGTTST